MNRTTNDYSQIDPPIALSTFRSLSFSNQEPLMDEDNKYLVAIKKLIDKYETLFHAHDSLKSEMNDKINHYISLNNSLYTRSSELSTQIREKTEQCNKLIKENSNIRLENDSHKQAIEKFKLKIVENNSVLEMNEKLIENMKKISLHKDKEFQRVKSEFSIQEAKSKEDLSIVCAEKNKLYEKCLKLEEIQKAAHLENFKIIENLTNNKNIMKKAQSELEHNLQLSSRQLSSLNGENESLKVIIAEKDKYILDILASKETLQEQNNQLLSTLSQLYQKQCTFKGTIINGKKEGFGFFNCPEFTHEGEFNNDKMHGEGIRTYSFPLKTLEGKFDANGFFTGNKMKLKEYVYTGEIVRDKMEGKGYIEIYDKFIIEASFKNDSVDENKNSIVIDLVSGVEEEVRYDSKSNCFKNEKGESLYFMDFQKYEFRKLE